MRCKQIRDLMPEYLIDEIAGDIKQSFDEHLGRCASCRLDLSLMQSVTEKIARSNTETPPAFYFNQFPRKIMGTIDELPAEHERHSWLPHPVWITAAGAAVLSIALLVFFVGMKDSLFSRIDTTSAQPPETSTMTNTLIAEELDKLFSTINITDRDDNDDIVSDSDPWELDPDPSADEWEEFLMEYYRDNTG